MHSSIHFLIGSDFVFHDKNPANSLKTLCYMLLETTVNWHHPIIPSCLYWNFFETSRYYSIKIFYRFFCRFSAFIFTPYLHTKQVKSPLCTLRINIMIPTLEPSCCWTTPLNFILSIGKIWFDWKISNPIYVGLN